MQSQETTYTLKKEYSYPNAIVRVYTPDLADEERERRYNILKKEVALYMMGLEKDRKEKKA